MTQDINSGTGMSQNGVAGDIRRRTEICQSLFSECLSNPLFSDLDWFENRRGDFNLWVASLKAASAGRSSLDYRVRDTPEVRELICDLLDGLSEALEGILRTGTADCRLRLIISGPNSDVAKTSALTSETESNLLLEPEDDVSSVFSSFSDDERDSDSLPSFGTADGPFSEQMFYVKTILEQLARASAAIRRSGAKYRHRKADTSLKEEDFEDLRTHLTIIILLGTVVAQTEEPADPAIRSRLIDSKLLTKVQERLIHANIIRRNRIIFATRSMKPVETPAARQPQQQPATGIEVPATTTESGPQFPQKPVEQISSGLAIPPQALTIKAPSITQTATEIGSQLNRQHVMELKKSTPSVATRATRIGAAQEYPSCPEPVPGGILQCPYCADLLPAAYSKDQSRWRYDIELYASDGSYKLIDVVQGTCRPGHTSIHVCIHRLRNLRRDVPHVR